MPEARPLSPQEAIPYTPAEAPKEEEQPDWSRVLTKPFNELKWAGKEGVRLLRESIVDPVVDAVESVQALDEGYTPVYRGTKGSSIYQAPDGTLAGNLPSQVEAQQGSIRALTQPLQYLGQPGQTARQALVDTSAGVIGATSEEDLVGNADARRVQGIGQFATETGVATLLTAGLGTLGGPARQMLPGWMQAGLGRVPFKRTLKWGAAVAGEEAIAGLLQDPLANPSFVFQLDENDTVWSAAAKNLPGNAIGGLVLGGTLEGGSRLLGKGINALLPNLSRKTRKQRAAQEVSESRTWAEENGIQQETPDGKTEFVPEEPEAEAAPAGNLLDRYDAQRTEKTTGVPTDPMVPGGAVTEGKLPDPADPAVDPWDPSLPETSTVVRGLDQLDDGQLKRLDEGEGVVEELDVELNEPTEFIDRPEALVAAPADRLADTTIPYKDQLAGIPNSELISMADPRNSEQLFRRVSEITGKELEDFTRADVLAGIESLANTDNLQFLPNRIDPQAGGLADVNSIQVDPQRFQYKDNINDAGQQKGNSLEGVEKWSTDFEGVIDVWEDPADGEIYVVNGHNRLAKAKEMGVGSIRANFIPARTAEQARAYGAAANIAAGSGTAFDAAKFLREQGFEDAQSLEAAGIPMASGLGSQGLALSKLPPGLFQDAVDGTLELQKAIAIGSSGLSPEDMIRVAGLSRDLSGAATFELVQMAQTAPKVESGQAGLFGAEFMDTLGIKADLAASVRAALNSDKNLFKRTAKDKTAAKLAERGNTQVDQAAAGREAQAVESALGTFQAEKYAEGTEVSRLLNEGTEDIAGGANKAAVVRRLVAEIAQQEPKAAPAPKPEVEATPESPTAQWEAMSQTELLAMRDRAEKKLLTDRKIKNREKLVSDFDDLLAEPGNELGVEMPAKVRKAQQDLQANDEAIEFINWYDQRNEAAPLTPEGRNEIKKRIVRKAINNGEIRPDSAPAPILDEPGPALQEMVLNPLEAINEEISLAGKYAQEDAAQAVAEARFVREENGYYEQSIQEKLDNGLLEDFPDDQTPEFPEPEGEPSYQLPADVAKSKPRYGMATVQFGSDLDRAAYIIRSKSKKSKGEDRIIASLEEQGLDVAAVRKHGEKVKKAIGDVIQEQTGSRRAPQEALQIDVPAVRFGEEVSYSVEGERIRSYADPEQRIRKESAVQAAQALTEIVTRTSGGGGKVKIRKGKVEMLIPPEHGGDGKRKGQQLGYYDHGKDLLVINNLLGRDISDLTQTVYHESWHRIQNLLLSKQEMALLNKPRNQERLRELAGFEFDKEGKASIEIQANAFQMFAYAKEMEPDMTFRQFLDMRRDSNAYQALEALNVFEKMNGGRMDAQVLVEVLQQSDMRKYQTMGDAIELAIGKGVLRPLEKFYERLQDLLERATNLVQGYGFRSLQDLFEEGYSGKLAQRGRQQFDVDDRYAMLKEWQKDNKRAVPRESDKIVIYAEALEQITTKQNELRELARMEGC